MFEELVHTHRTSAGPSGSNYGAWATHAHLTAWGQSGPPIFTTTGHSHLTGTVQTFSAGLPLIQHSGNVQRARRGPKWMRGVDGILETEKQYEDVDIDQQDWTDRLDGESIVAAAWSTDGVTINASDFSNSATIVEVTGIGSCHVDITTDAGRVFREYFRWKRLHRPIMNNYGGGDCIPGDYR